MLHFEVSLRYSNRDIKLVVRHMSLMFKGEFLAGEYTFGISYKPMAYKAMSSNRIDGGEIGEQKPRKES